MLAGAAGQGGDVVTLTGILKPFASASWRRTPQAVELPLGQHQPVRLPSQPQQDMGPALGSSEQLGEPGVSQMLGQAGWGRSVGALRAGRWCSLFACVWPFLGLDTGPILSMHTCEAAPSLLRSQL